MNPTQNICLLGSTGSIGTQALDVIRRHPDRFKVTALTANNNWRLLAEQIKEFNPDIALIGETIHRKDFESLTSGTKTRLLYGSELIPEIAGSVNADIVLNSLVGFSGFLPTYEALKSGKKVALANKESLVVGGELLKPWLGCDYRNIIPIDSEHSAILQCLMGEDINTVEKITITASGGPFRSIPVQDLKNVKVEDALKHPNWEMGAKITIDSATMMNKGLEIIEAYWLFGLPLTKIDAVIHPQSIIHSFVGFNDGSVKAQLGLPDMRVPIQYALSYPDRWPLKIAVPDWVGLHMLSFESIDFNRYPCYRLALESIRTGGCAPVVLNAANEVAVSRFLNQEIPYIKIHKIIESSLVNFSGNFSLSIDNIQETDNEARKLARSL